MSGIFTETKSLAAKL